MNALAPHPLALAIPEMLTDEYLELVADIKRHGLKQPIVRFEGQILDGRHRARACRELGMEASEIEFAGTAADAKAFVLSANVHRRHLTFEQKQTIISAELKRDPEQSDRQIAKKAKVDHKTVAKVRSESATRGEIPHVETRTDTKGRKQPATKSQREKKPPQEKTSPPPISSSDDVALVVDTQREAASATSTDKEAKRIVRELENMQQDDLSDPAWFAERLHYHGSRLDPLAISQATSIQLADRSEAS